MARRGEIWLVDLDSTRGSEIQKRRPVLVLSKEAHNRYFPAFVAPITGGGGSARDAGFAVTLSGAGLNTIGAVLAHQIRPVDLKARGAKYIETAPDVVIDEVIEKLTLILSPDD